MTRKEFYLKSIISMAGNKAFAVVPRALDVDAIAQSATSLVCMVDEEWPEAFDEEPADDFVRIAREEIGRAIEDCTETLRTINDIRAKLWKD